jgi:Na+/proline symporter
VVLSRIDLAAIHGSLAAEQPMLLSVLMPVALLSLFNNMFFGFGEVFHNNVWWSRAFAMKEAVAHKAFGLAGLLWFPIPIAAGFIGLCAGPLGINVPDPDMVGPLVAGQVLGGAGAIVVFVVVFCSLASSIDSLLAATADLLAEDVYRKWLAPGSDPARLRRVSSWLIVGLGALTWALCMPRLGDLIQVLFLSGPLVASAIFPVVGGLFWRKATGPAALGAMLAGSAAGLTAYFTLGWFTASLISAAVSAAVMGLGTLASKSRFDWSVLDESAAAEGGSR